jgi:hypothetical protein
MFCRCGAPAQIRNVMACTEHARLGQRPELDSVKTVNYCTRLWDSGSTLAFRLGALPVI